MTLSNPDKYQLRAAQRALIQLVEGVREALSAIEAEIGPLERWEREPALVADLYDDTPIEELELSVRSFHCLESEKVRTVAELSEQCLVTVPWGKAQ